MNMRRFLFLVCALLAFGVNAAAAQQPAPPPSYQLNGITHIYQDWNNCGPATLTMGLTYFGVAADQYPAARWLKPNTEDKNVSPWQMVAYVNEQLNGSVRALQRQGGTVELLKVLISNQFPVIVEAGYDPPNDPQGWMGHYLLISGYDDATSVFVTQDSFEGPNYHYEYTYLDDFWRHFNRLYIVLYEQSREAELMRLLGEDADPRQNAINALEQARAEAIANPNDPFAWFNMGTNFLALEMPNEAATAYDQARNVGDGLPWRMLWYQFGPYEAYLQTNRPNDVLELARAKLNDGGGQYVEETYYYGGRARALLGETERAISNLNGAISFNPNFTPAREALASVQGTSG
jgi:tetratricopeptide (TPR) repeat protein